LNGLATEVDDTPALAPMRDHMERHLAKAMALFDKAQSRCQLAKRRPAKRSLRLVRQRLVKVGKALRSKLARKTLPPTVTDPIGREASALGLDVRALATTISCR
jgi:hypothetical protein